MSTPYRIFVATDLSANSDEAIRQADERARARSGELLVCHILPTIERINPVFPHLSGYTFADRTALHDRARTLVTRRVQELTERGDSAFGVLLDEGIPHAVIVEKAEEWQADLVVIGGQGASGLFGSVAQKVVRYAHSPVLVARPRAARGRVLAATDFSDAALPAIAAAAEEARARGARLTVMHAIDIGISTTAAMSAALGSPIPAVPADVQESVARAARTMLKGALDQVGAEGDTLVVEGAPAQAIERAVADLAPELLVVGTAGRTGLRRVLLGSVAETVLQRAACSVIVVRLSART